MSVTVAVSEQYLVIYGTKNTIDATKRWNVADIIEDDKKITFRLIEGVNGKGNSFFTKKSDPAGCGQLQFSLHVLRGGTSLPKFRSTPAQLDGMCVIVQKAHLRKYVPVTGIKRRKKSHIIPKTATETHDIRSAVQTINAAKAEMGDSLVLSITPEGVLKAMMEF